MLNKHRRGTITLNRTKHSHAFVLVGKTKTYEENMHQKCCKICCFETKDYVYVPRRVSGSTGPDMSCLGGVDMVMLLQGFI